MSSVLHFSPAFKPSLSFSHLPAPPHEPYKKRKRGFEPMNSDGGNGSGGGLETDSAANGASTSLAAPNVDIVHGDNPRHSQTFSHTDHEGLHASRFPLSFSHHVAETASFMSKGRISNELATLKPVLYVSTGRVPTATVEKLSGSTGLRQHHLNNITAVLHRCLSEGDYIRAGRAWAMLLRAEQNGHSMDLRTHDRWGIGAEILMQRELQLAQKTLAHSVVEHSSSPPKLRVKAESMERAKEYYERIVLQYPYRKALPNASGPLNFAIAMFSLWIHTVKERSSIALMAFGRAMKDIEETDAGANDVVQSSFASDMEPDRYRKREQVRKETLHSAYEIATGLDGLLASPPYFDNAKFWKLCAEVFLWIADLSVATIFSKYRSSISEDDDDLTVENLPLTRNVSRSTSLNEEQGAEQERQKALKKAKEAFQRVKLCGESSAE